MQSTSRDCRRRIAVVFVPIFFLSRRFWCFFCFLRVRAGGASAVVQMICMAPFWFAGGKLGLETVKRVCVWERLEVGLSR